MEWSRLQINNDYVENVPVYVVKYDLLRELPAGIGDRFPNSIHFTEDDVDPIADAVFDKMKHSRESPECLAQFDIYLKGKFPDWLAGQLTAIFIEHGEIRRFKILHPDGSCYWMFPRGNRRD